MPLPAYPKHIKAILKRNCAGNLDQRMGLVNERSERNDNIDGRALLVSPKEEGKHLAVKSEPLDFKALLAEASAGDPTTPIRKTFPIPSQTHAQQRQETPEQYDPTKLLDIGRELQQAKQSRSRPANSWNNVSNSSNSFLLTHIISGAPNTGCRKCTQSRLCPLHRQSAELTTTVSLCEHRRLVLYWQRNDPTNRRGTWSIRVRDYTNSHYGWEGKRDCEQNCRIAEPSQRAWLSAERLVEDFEEEKGRVRRMRRWDDKILKLRGPNMRWAEDEIRGLIAAMEEAVERRRKEEERKAERAKREWEEKLKRQLEMLKGLEEQQQSKRKRSDEVEDTVPSKKARTDSPEPVISRTPESETQQCQASPSFEQEPQELSKNPSAPSPTLGPYTEPPTPDLIPTGTDNSTPSTASHGPTPPATPLTPSTPIQAPIASPQHTSTTSIPGLTPTTPTKRKASSELDENREDREKFERPIKKVRFTTNEAINITTSIDVSNHELLTKKRHSIEDVVDFETDDFVE